MSTYVFAAVQTRHLFVLIQTNVLMKCDKFNNNKILQRLAQCFPAFFPPKILLQHNDFIVLVSFKSQLCTCSVHLGSGELIWGTLEICFLYIGHDNSSPDILQWLPARVFLLLLFLVDIQEATWHLMSTACLLVTSEMKEGCNGICIRHLFFK